MLLGVVSDTHGHVAFAREAVRILESMSVDAVVHCGDIGAVEIVPLFAAWPTHFVFGNVDGDGVSLRRAIASAGLHCHERFGQVDLAGVSIAFLHGDDGRLLDETIASGRHRLVCHGHTHVARNQKVGGTLVLNPGALYRANPRSLAIVELPEVRAMIIPTSSIES